MKLSLTTSTVISAALLAGCSHNQVMFRPTMGADASEIGYEAQALVNEMRLAYDETACASAAIPPSYQNTQSEKYRRLHKSPSARAMLNCVRFRQPNEATITPKRYFESGILLSDIYCDDYFRRIALHKQTRQFGRSATNDIGTAASAALGLASAGSIATGGIGAAFGLADNLFRNYDAAFVVEPNLGKLLRLVKTAQSATRGSYAPETFQSFVEAQRAVADYAQNCSYVGMADLLDRAIEQGTQAAANDSASDEADSGDQP